MADGDKFYGPASVSGQTTGTGAAITIELNFKPIAVVLNNVDGEAQLFWFQGMAADKGYKINGVPSGTNASSAVTGTGTFSGTAPSTNLDLASPAFSGTGLTAAGQVITTTDNQTMTLNQCAGMWLISATGATPPNLILSNTAVTGAPAVLTVQGSANTDAGAYKIVKHAAPVGSVTALSGTAAGQTFTGGTSFATYIASGGITIGNSGFIIGTDTDVNVLNENIHWIAFR